jgi:glyoxylase I family protein
MKLVRLHHIAVISSDYAVSRHFYTQILGLEVIREVYREARDSYKLDLLLPDGTQIELFSFPNPPARPTHPEARGARHIAFEVEDLDVCVTHLESNGVKVEAVRLDEFTNQRFTFFPDPDGLPLELYEGHK